MTAKNPTAGTASADFRSDTVTRPSAAMRAAIASAEVGDDVLDGDPTVARLEAVGAAFLGKPAALFVPSGTMANQLAVGVWTQPGEEVILEERAHILSYESGALGALHGCQSRTLPGDGGAMDLGVLTAAIRPDFIHCPNTGLVAVEQTHMSSGGRVIPEAYLAELGALCREHDLPLHMDGARLAHAAVATGRPAADFTRHVSSVSLCLSKSLGAPVGSLVAGDEEFIERARFLRKRFGGWMRQSGILAAAGLMALEENVERLAEDHALARAVAATLDAHASLSASPDSVETNLVLCDVTPTPAAADAAALAERLGEHGVRVMALSPHTLRFVTHLDVAPLHNAQLRTALEAILGPPEPTS